MIDIDNSKRIDWPAIRAEYIGGATIRKLAQKYGVNKSTIGDRCSAERWTDSRAEAADKARTVSVQKTAEAAADNAVIAAGIKKSLLLRLQRIEEGYPFDATEVRTRKGNSTVVYKIRDLTAAYKYLTEDMPKAQAPNELLQSLFDLERDARL